MKLCFDHVLEKDSKSKHGACVNIFCMCCALLQVRFACKPKLLRDSGDGMLSFVAFV